MGDGFNNRFIKKLNKDFRNKNKKTVEYLAKEFEMKKAADAHSRTATANSGIIDTGILHTYKYNEHIFRKINVTADGKNHGLVMVVDWSGSMAHNLQGTLNQLYNIIWFCNQVKIPFEANFKNLNLFKIPQNLYIINLFIADNVATSLTSLKDSFLIHCPEWVLSNILSNRFEDIFVSTLSISILSIAFAFGETKINSKLGCFSFKL